MQHIKRLMVFAHVVESGSMTAAARQLAMTPSAVSQQIRQLESETGVVLLHRSTRKLTLTAAGEGVYESCRDMLAAARQAEQRLLAQREAPLGELRIASTILFARAHLTRALAPMLQEFPELALWLIATNEAVDLIAERIDLAFRLGPAEDSSLVARNLAALRYVLCATPAYLERMGHPVVPEDLHQHQMLILTSRANPTTFPFTHESGELRVLELNGRIQCNESQTLGQLNEAGFGILHRFEFDVQESLASGKLVRVLPDWHLPEVNLYAVTSSREAQPAKVRHAIEAVRRYLAQQKGNAVRVFE